MPRNKDGTWNTKTGCPPYQFWTEQAHRYRNSGTTHSGKRIILDMDFSEIEERVIANELAEVRTADILQSCEQNLEES